MSFLDFTIFQGWGDESFRISWATGRVPIYRARGRPYKRELRTNFQGGGKPAPTIHGPGGLIRGLVGATLAVALGGGGVWLKFASMGIAPISANLSQMMGL